MNNIKERIKIYNATYYYNPCERDAYITSSKTVKQLVALSNIIDKNIITNLNWLILKSEISGYIKKDRIISPSETFFKYINKEDILQECSNNFTLEERLRYGLSISNEEYSRIINARNNIETKILER